MGKIIVKETANEKETKEKPTEKKVVVSEVEMGGVEKEEKSVAIVDANEVEKIADSADVFTDDETKEAETEDVRVEEAKTEEGGQSKAKPQKSQNKATKATKVGKKSMSGMVMDFRSGAPAEDTKPQEDAEEAADETQESRKAPLSKPKSVLLAVATAIVVGLVGGLIIWLTGNHEAQYCVVEFEPNGGTAVEEQTVACGAIIERPDDPEKDGFEFLGWMYNGEVFDFYSMRAVSGMILKARWEALPNVEIVTVKFDADGGSEVEAISVKKGEKIKTSPITKRSGYRFLGWYRDTGEKLVKFDFNKAITENMTLEAMWDLIPQEEPEKPAEQPTTPSDPVEKAVESIEVSNLTLNVGELRDDIRVTITPADAKREITISMSDSAREVVDCAGSLSETGTLTCWAIAPGEARVIVKDTKSGVFGAFKITVLPIPVESVTISGPASYALDAGATVTLSARVTPSTATYRTVDWSSSDTAIAEVSSDGTVTAKAGGSATITATASGKSSSITVHVSEPEPETPEVSVKISSSVPGEVTSGATIELAAEVENASEASVEWSVKASDGVSATIEGNALKVEGAGTVTVTARIGEVKDTKTINVAAADEGGDEAPGEGD